MIIGLLASYTCFSQQLVYSDIIYGGVTGNGATRGAGSGIITMNVQIPPNSTIKKAFLIAARGKDKAKVTVTLNTKNYRFSDSTIVTNGFLSFSQGGTISVNSSMHAIDITADIDSSINSYNLFIPPPTGSSGGYDYFEFYYLYIVFENFVYPKINCSLFLNNQDVAPITTYNLNNINPFNNTQPIGLAVATSHFCGSSYINDSSYISINNNTIGLLGGEDLNSSMVTCASTWSNFAHYNDSLFGLDDDNPDSLMAGTDALADIKSYVTNGDTVVNVTFTYQTLDNSNGGIYTNPIRAVMLSYSTPCDTFTTTASTNIDTICQGESVQLAATGGVEYSWFSAFSTFNDSTLANPVATPTQTTTYIVTIKNDSGCVKTEHVKVWVNPAPKPDTIITTPQRCGSTNGSIAVGYIPKGKPPFVYNLTNLQSGNSVSQSDSAFVGLTASEYQLVITDSNGCTWQSDTLPINEINDISANFNLYTLPLVIPTPNPLGTAPLTVYTQNASANANTFEWVFSLSADTLAQYSAYNAAHTFDEGGTFEVCLFAYNNIPQCGDTLCKTVVIAPAPDSLVLIVPNVFTPNADGMNDNFVMEIQCATLLKTVAVEIFNRWGQALHHADFDVQKLSTTKNSLQLTLWNGTTNSGAKVPEGTYFYIIEYTKVSGEKESLKGSMSLLR